MRRFFLLLLPVWLLADLKPSELIKLEARLYPKMVLMDYDIDAKRVAGTIRFVIIYDDANHNLALAFREQAREQSAAIGNYAFEYDLVPVGDVSRCGGASAYLLLFDAEALASLPPLEPGRLIFVLSKAVLQHRGTITLDVSDKITPLIHVSRLKAYGIELKPILLKVAKHYE